MREIVISCVPAVIRTAAAEPGRPLWRRRVCRTRAEWDELRSQTRQAVECIQTEQQTR